MPTQSASKKFSPTAGFCCGGRVSSCSLILCAAQFVVRSGWAILLMLLLAVPAQAGGSSGHPDIYRKLVKLCVKLEHKSHASCVARVRKNMAHMKQPLRNGYWWAGGSGGSPSVYIDMVKRMNRQGNTAVFGRSCTSACAIAWSLARKKCLLYGGKIALQQHVANGRSEIVNYHSRNAAYWRRVTSGKKKPSRQLVRYKDWAPKCPQGIAIAGYRRSNSGGHRTSAAPSVFQATGLR